jgi:hypothetical protein
MTEEVEESQPCLPRPKRLPPSRCIQESASRCGMSKLDEATTHKWANVDMNLLDDGVMSTIVWQQSTQ